VRCSGRIGLTRVASLDVSRGGRMRFDSFEAVRSTDPIGLRALLRNGDGPERVWAAWSLALQNDASFAAEVVSGLPVERDPGVRCHLVVILAGLGEMAALRVLATCDPEPEVRAAAAEYVIRTAGAPGNDDAATFVRERLHREQHMEPLARMLDEYPLRLARIPLTDLQHLLPHHEPRLRGALLGYLERAYPPADLFPGPLEPHLAAVEAEPALLVRLARLARGVAEGAAVAAAVRVPEAALSIVEELAADAADVRPWDVVAPLADHADPRVRLAVLLMQGDDVGSEAVRWLAGELTREDDVGSRKDARGRYAAFIELKERSRTVLVDYATTCATRPPEEVLRALRRLLEDVDDQLTWLLAQDDWVLEDEGIEFTPAFDGLIQKRTALVAALRRW
jgi:hypothetical protein